MTRLWLEAISVEVDASGNPCHVVWRGEVHGVVWIAKQWRVDLDWWSVRVWRTYYKLTTETGLLLIVYCDLVSGDWYLQRVYD